MTDAEKALSDLHFCRQYRKTEQGDTVLELMEPLTFDWFCRNEETIRKALQRVDKVQGLIYTLQIAKRDFKNWLPNKDAREAAIAHIDKALSAFGADDLLSVNQEGKS